MHQKHSPRVCVIVLNYNGRRHLEYCLPAIQRTDYQPLDILVVDNASTDDSVPYVQSAFPTVHLLACETNWGWSGGNNRGVEWARRRGARYVVLANNDIRPDSRWVRCAVELAESDPAIAIAGFRILEPSGQSQADDSGFDEAVAGWAGLQVHETRVVDGMAMFVRTELFERIGPIDEEFFAYAEDNDLVWRALKAGYRVVRTNVPVWHYGAGTFGERPLWAASLQMRNNLRLAIKHESPAGVLYQAGRHLAKGCLPFLKTPAGDRVARRLRPSNVFVNFGLWLYAVTWNLWRLPATLRRRREDERRIRAARREGEAP